MNKAFKARWIKALVSGKYKQGKAVLQTEQGKFCCLGVAGDLLAQDGYAHWRKTHLLDNALLSGNGKNVQLGITGLPLNACKRIGLTTQAAADLADMNDDGKKFKTIAKWIQENL